MGGSTENLSAAVGVLIKVDLFCRAPHSHTTMSCVSAVHQSPRLAASRRVSMNSKALSAPPGNKNGTICLRCITPCHEGSPCAMALSPRRLPSHYFTLKYIAVFCIADTALRGRRSGLTGWASVRWGAAARVAVDGNAARISRPLKQDACCLFVAAPHFVLLSTSWSLSALNQFDVSPSSQYLMSIFQIWASSKEKKKGSP